MKSILYINKENYKKRKKAYLMVALSLILSSMFLGLSLSLLKLVDRPFDMVFNKLNGSHIILLYDYNSVKSSELNTWFQNQNEVESITEPTPYFMFNGPFIYKNTEIDVMAHITEHNTSNLKQDKLLVVTGANKKHPEIGEVWLPNHFASNYGMLLNDTISINTAGGIFHFTISAFVTDPHYLSGVINPTRIWVSSGSLSFYAPIQEINNVMTGVRLKKPEHLEKVMKEFNDEFEFQGTKLEYTLFKAAFSSLYKILSTVLLFFSILALIISLIVIKATISSQILSDFKQIGVLKSIGFTPLNIILIYVSQFSFIAIIAIPIGLTASSLVVESLIESMISSIGLSTINYELSSSYIVTSIVVMTLVLLITLFQGNKAGKIKPMEALRNSFNAKKKHLSGKSSMFMQSANLPLSAILGISYLRERNRGKYSLALSFVFIIFIIVFSINVSHSFSRLGENKPAWGFDSSDIIVSRSNSKVLALNHKQIIETFESKGKEIKTIIPYSYSTLSILSDNNKPVQEIFGKVYSGNISDFGLMNLQGRSPKNADEIAICSGTSKKFNKHSGDSIKVFIEGQIKTFTVCGIYQDISNFGQGFRLHQEAMVKLNPLFEPNLYGLELSPEVNKEEFKNQLLKEIGASINIEMSVEESKTIIGIISNMKAGTIAISIFFILIMAIIINNHINIYINQNKLSFGKLKSIGYTTKQLKKSLIWKMGFILLIGGTVGTALSILSSPMIMGALTSGIGLDKFPFTSSFTGTAAANFGLFLVVLLSTWIASSNIRKLNPRILITD